MKKGFLWFVISLASFAGYIFASRKLEDTRDFR